MWDVWTVTPSKVERRDRAERPRPPRGLERRRQEEYRVLLGEQWASGWLAFETKGEKRRLAPIPEGWDKLGPNELERLCNDATEVGPPRRLVE